MTDKTKIAKANKARWEANAQAFEDWREARAKADKAWEEAMSPAEGETGEAK